MNFHGYRVRWIVCGMGWEGCREGRGVYSEEEEVRKAGLMGGPATVKIVEDA